MRKTIWITVLTFITAMAVCLLVKINIGRLVTHARHLRTEAIEAMDEGRIQLAEERMVELAGYIGRNQEWLEMVCDHADLHEMKGNIIDAQASIEFGIEDDFYQAIYRFGEGLDHIDSIERIRLSNLY